MLSHYSSIKLYGISLCTHIHYSCKMWRKNHSLSQYAWWSSPRENYTPYQHTRIAMADGLWIEKLPFHQQRCFNPARGRRSQEDWSRGIKSPASIILAGAYFASNTETFCFLSSLPTAVGNEYGDSLAYFLSLSVYFLDSVQSWIRETVLRLLTILRIIEFGESSNCYYLISSCFLVLSQ